MKKLIVLILVLILVLSVVSCGKATSNPSPSSVETAQPQTATTPPEQTHSTESDNDATPLNVLLTTITEDFNSVTNHLTQKLDDTFSNVGTTFEEYKEHKGLINEWIDLVLSESDELFSRTKDNSISYFRLIAADPNHTDREFCDGALDEYYDVVYDDAMDVYYDRIYDDAMDNLYDKYYNGIIDDAFESLEYSEWNDASVESYQTWINANTEIYKRWVNASSYFYGLWLAFDSAFCYHDSFDVDAILAEYEEKNTNNSEAEDIITESPEDITTESPEDITTESPDNSSANSPEPTQNDTVSAGIRPEFKEAMDTYEAFFDEYCEFMKKYKENPTDMTLLTEYAEMISRLQEVQAAFDQWQEREMNNAELAYYMEVTNRVNQKLLELG